MLNAGRSPLWALPHEAVLALPVLMAVRMLDTLDGCLSLALGASLAVETENPACDRQ